MITFTLRVPMEPFYDKLRLPKGPSFGMKTTLICAYMYLAHYDLVTKDNAQPVKSGDVTAFAAYNVAAAPYLYSTAAAQRDAKNRAANDIAERIRLELAVYLRQVAQQ